MRFLTRLSAVAASLALSLAVAAPAAALTAEERATVFKASTYINAIQAMQGRFTQIGPDGRRVVGNYYIERPGKVRFDYDEPSDLRVIADGRIVAVRDTSNGKQEIYPLDRTPLRFLVNQVDLVNDVQVLGVYADPGRTTLVVADPKSGDGRLSLTFDGPDFTLKQWTVTDAQGLDTTVVLDSMQSGSGLPDRLFKVQR